jgi:trehalose 6-phosphate synthase/phosphatase
METKRLAVVSNRLPIVLKQSSGTWEVTPGAGGLVTAMGPVLRDRGGLWIGWLGIPSEQVAGDERSIAKLLDKRGASKAGYSLKPVSLTGEEIESFYKGFSNEIIWPLFHDFPSICNFEPAYWEAYRKVNRKFAQAIVEFTEEDDYVWIHDYHLILVAAELKRLGVTRQLGFYQHIPFPSLDIFLKLPWRFKILDAMKEYDLIGFQTMRDRRNFIQCVRAMTGGSLKGRGHVSSLISGSREMRVGAFPISIDYEEFSRLAASRKVSDRVWSIRSNMQNVKIMLGVDRLDYSKGIPQRLRAMADALERYPDLQGQLVLVQVVVPSRRSVETYESLKQEIERLVGEINGRFTKNGWNPIQYIFRSLDRSNLVSYYRTSDIALVTPLKDGMNLVAKEYCACNIEEESGVLILSEFAGAAGQLQKGALLVNPYDITGMADAIYQAFLMEPEERRRRMRILRRSIQKSTIFHWVNSFLKAGIEKDLNYFPRQEDFVPSPSERDLEEDEEPA